MTTMTHDKQFTDLECIYDLFRDATMDLTDEAFVGAVGNAVDDLWLDLKTAWNAHNVPEIECALTGIHVLLDDYELDETSYNDLCDELNMRLILRDEADEVERIRAQRSRRQRTHYPLCFR